MKFEVQLRGPTGKDRRTVQLERSGRRWRFSINGELLEADIVEIDAHTVSILLDGRSYAVQITQPSEGILKLQTALQEYVAEVVDGRVWRGRRGNTLEVQGRQQIVAPMPGKVIRVLVNKGDKVEAGQGLFVVEAMKMQNEIRSPKAGTVEQLLAKEGEAVNADEILCVVA